MTTPFDTTRHRALAALLLCATIGCQGPGVISRSPLDDPPEYPKTHTYVLDELVELAVYRNASLDVARYEAEAARGLVDQVKSLWLPSARFNFAAVGYDNDFNYKADVYNIATLNVPVTGNYNLITAVSVAQILSTGGKRTSGLKQAKMYAAIQELEVLRKEDVVVLDVVNYYYLMCLADSVDRVLADTVRRLAVYRQVARELNARGSLRGSNLDALLADYLVLQIEQARIAIRAGRNQAYHALRHFVGVGMDEPMRLRSLELPPVASMRDIVERSTEIIGAWFRRPELRQVDLFVDIRAAQVEFAKAAWMPNIVLLGTINNVQSDNNSVLGIVEGILGSLIVDLPLYAPARRGRLRQALALEQAALAFRRQVEELITLEIEVTATDVQRAFATALKANQARQVADEHYRFTRQASSREIVPTSSVVTAIIIDALARIQELQSRYDYHFSRARLKRVSADREARYAS